MIARLVMVLPEPDSPTRPSEPPGPIWKSMWSTTVAWPPSRRLTVTDRSRASSAGSWAAIVRFP